MPAALIAAGLDEIAENRDPGMRSDVNTYTDLSPATVKRLPQNLLDALRCLGQSQTLANYLGREVISSYLKLKYQE